MSASLGPSAARCARTGRQQEPALPADSESLQTPTRDRDPSRASSRPGRAAAAPWCAPARRDSDPGWKTVSWMSRWNVDPPVSCVTAFVGRARVCGRVARRIRRHAAARCDLLRIAKPVLHQRGRRRDEDEMRIGHTRQTGHGHHHEQDPASHRQSSWTHIRRSHHHKRLRIPGASLDRLLFSLCGRRCIRAGARMTRTLAERRPSLG